MNAWCGDGDIWIEAADPAGSRSALIDSVVSAVLSDFKSFDAGGGTVSSSWITDKVEGYEFSRMDQDVRKAIDERFAAEGIKVVK